VVTSADLAVIKDDCVSTVLAGATGATIFTITTTTWDPRTLRALLCRISGLSHTCRER
jgi:hypothetical protein